MNQTLGDEIHAPQLRLSHAFVKINETVRFLPCPSLGGVGCDFAGGVRQHSELHLIVWRRKYFMIDGTIDKQALDSTKNNDGEMMAKMPRRTGSKSAKKDFRVWAPYKTRESIRQ